MEATTERALGSIVRRGTVTDRSAAARKVRVKFHDLDMTSGWLPVLQRGEDWVPEIGDTVLTLYEPLFNGGGYVIGGI